MERNAPGTLLSCTNPDCGCRVRIEAPCPHGDVYLCACNHRFEPVEQHEESRA